MLEPTQRRWWRWCRFRYAALGCDGERSLSGVDGEIGRDKPAGYLIDSDSALNEKKSVVPVVPVVDTH